MRSFAKIFKKCGTKLKPLHVFLFSKHLSELIFIFLVFYFKWRNSRCKKQKKQNRLRWWKNWNFRDFQVFDFAIYLKSETWKSQNAFFYFSFRYYRKLKTLKTKKWRYGLIKEKEISVFSEFSILPFTRNRKLWNLRKFSFTSSFDRFDCIKPRESLKFWLNFNLIDPMPIISKE